MSGVHSVAGDVADPESLAAACDGVDSVVHTVAIIREKGKSTFDAVNVKGALNVAHAASRAGVKKIVHLSAIGADPNPRYPYLRSKWDGEQAIINNGVEHVILRPSLVFGPGDEFINALAATVRVGPMAPTLGSGGTRFQPIHVDDVARCVDAALADPALSGRTIEIGGPDILTVREMTEMIVRAYGRWKLSVRVPLWAVRVALPLMSLALPHPPLTRVQLDMLGLDNVAGPDSVRGAFGFEPRSLEGNLDYILDMTWREAFGIVAGFRPARRWPESS